MRKIDYDVYMKLEEVKTLVGMWREIIRKIVDVGNDLSKLYNEDNEPHKLIDGLQTILDNDMGLAIELVDLTDDLVALAEVFNQNQDYEAIHEVALSIEELLSGDENDSKCL